MSRSSPSSEPAADVAAAPAEVEDGAEVEAERDRAEAPELRVLVACAGAPLRPRLLDAARELRAQLRLPLARHALGFRPRPGLSSVDAARDALRPQRRRQHRLPGLRRRAVRRRDLAARRAATWSSRWEVPMMRAYSERLASFARVINFDKRGVGLSDKSAGYSSPETRMDDIRAVMDAAGSGRAAVIGWSEGVRLSLLFAATYPDRVWALVALRRRASERSTEPGGEGASHCGRSGRRARSVRSAIRWPQRSRRCATGRRTPRTRSSAPSRACTPTGSARATSTRTHG